MVTLTETAAKKVETLRLEEGKPEWGLRLRVVGGGCSGFSYELGWEDAAQDGDEVIEVGRRQGLRRSQQRAVRGRGADRLRRQPVRLRLLDQQPELQGQLRLRALLPGLIPVRRTGGREAACGSRSRCSRDTVRR